MLRSHHLGLIKAYRRKPARRRVLKVWLLESPEWVRQGMCVRLVWSAVFLVGVTALGSVGLPLLAEGGSQVMISWCTWPTSVGKSKNM